MTHATLICRLKSLANHPVLGLEDTQVIHDSADLIESLKIECAHHKRRADSLASLLQRDASAGVVEGLADELSRLIKTIRKSNPKTEVLDECF